MYAGFHTGDKLKYMHIWSIGPDGHEYKQNSAVLKRVN